MTYDDGRAERIAWVTRQLDELERRDESFANKLARGAYPDGPARVSSFRLGAGSLPLWRNERRS
jgi:hypothetical protein